MGTLSGTDFNTEILAALGNRTDINYARVCTALNLAQTRLSRFYDFNDMALVQLGTLSFTGNPAADKFLTLPTGLKTIHSLVLVDNTSAGSLWSSRKMVEKPWRWFDNQFPVPEVLPPEWPSIYTRWGNILTMAPPPMYAFGYQLRYMGMPTPFASGTPSQTSDFTNKDDILLEDSLRHFWRSLGRMDQAEIHEKRVERLVEEAIQREDTRPDMDVALDISSIGLNIEQYWNNPFIAGAP
jgi:hypothetical protein